MRIGYYLPRKLINLFFFLCFAIVVIVLGIAFNKDEDMPMHVEYTPLKIRPKEQPNSNVPGDGRMIYDLVN